jgi:hypothetical protein
LETIRDLKMALALPQRLPAKLLLKYHAMCYVWAWDISIAGAENTMVRAFRPQGTNVGLILM